MALPKLGKGWLRGDWPVGVAGGRVGLARVRRPGTTTTLPPPGELLPAARLVPPALSPPGAAVDDGARRSGVERQGVAHAGDGVERDVAAPGIDRRIARQVHRAGCREGTTARRHRAGETDRSGIALRAGRRDIAREIRRAAARARDARERRRAADNTVETDGASAGGKRESLRAIDCIGKCDVVIGRRQRRRCAECNRAAIELVPRGRYTTQCRRACRA